ncbi:hypothetical protein IMZ48_45460 [Candidatus Bathyarchaeota archaeon]|nr:hypothetical protein [Candidatus Bathyarchaeota archaeon]
MPSVAASQFARASAIPQTGMLNTPGVRTPAAIAFSIQAPVGSSVVWGLFNSSLCSYVATVLGGTQVSLFQTATGTL